MNPEQKVYRTPVWVFLTQAVVVFWGLTLLRRGYFLAVEGRWVPIEDVTIIGGTLILLIIAVALTYWYGLRVSETELRGPTFWGSFHTIARTEPIAWRHLGFLGFQYLRIHGGGKGAIWLTLPVSDQGDLMALLEAQARER